jgi:5-methylcytosine-specific restriction endonuclease McrA
MNLVERKRVLSVFSGRRAKARDSNLAFGFSDGSDFVSWWEERFRLQKGSCYYCETSILLIAELIKEKQLPARKVAGNGFRGSNLEVERLDSHGPYDRANCVLACYYCNNDKSYTSNADDYRTFFGPARKAYYEMLATKANIQP